MITIFTYNVEHIVLEYLDKKNFRRIFEENQKNNFKFYKIYWTDGELFSLPFK